MFIESRNWTVLSMDRSAVLFLNLTDLDSVETVIVLPFDEASLSDISSLKNASHLRDLLASVDDDPELEFAQVRSSTRYRLFMTLHPEMNPGFDALGELQVPFHHPLCILFSSGTTGKPKCMVHSVGGTLIQHRKEHELLGDLGVGDILFYYTTVRGHAQYLNTVSRSVSS